VAAVVVLGLVLVVVGGLLGVIVLAHIVGRTKIAHPGWWPAQDDRPR
jgi:hypothetical protein